MPTELCRLDEGGGVTKAVALLSSTRSNKKSSLECISLLNDFFVGEEYKIDANRCVVYATVVHTWYGHQSKWLAGISEHGSSVAAPESSRLGRPRIVRASSVCGLRSKCRAGGITVALVRFGVSGTYALLI